MESDLHIWTVPANPATYPSFPGQANFELVTGEIETSSGKMWATNFNGFLNNYNSYSLT